MSLVSVFSRNSLLSSPHSRWCHGGRTPFVIPDDIVHPRAAVAIISPLSNTAAFDCAYTVSITSSIHLSDCVPNLVGSLGRIVGGKWVYTAAKEPKKGKDPTSSITGGSVPSA